MAMKSIHFILWFTLCLQVSIEIFTIPLEKFKLNLMQ